MLKGIDVSNWQGDINFNAVKRNGIEIVYIKASEGIDYKDIYLEQNYIRAKQAGLKVGFYHFFRGDSKAEARWFASCIRDKVSDCLLALDVEVDCEMDVNSLTTSCIEFLEEVKKITGNNVVVYTYTSFANYNLDNRLSKYPVWIAEYGVSSPQSNSIWGSNWVGFQYSEKGQIEGISGNCDVNTFTNSILNIKLSLNKNEGIVIADVLNVRDKPAGNIIGQLNCNEIVTIDKKVDNWYSIYYGNHGGYVSADYIKTVTTTTKAPIKQYRNIVVYSNNVDRRAAEYLADYFNNLNEDGKAINVKNYREGMGISVWAVGGGLNNLKANVYLKGKNRFDTLKAVCKKMNL